MTPEHLTRIRVGLSSEQLQRPDEAARLMHRSRAEIIRRAVESYLDDLDDVIVAVERMRDSDDPVLDWDQVKGGLFVTG